MPVLRLAANAKTNIRADVLESFLKGVAAIILVLGLNLLLSVPVRRESKAMRHATFVENLHLAIPHLTSGNGNLNLDW